MENTIQCPKCKAKIQLTEAVVAQVREELEQQHAEALVRARAEVEASASQKYARELARVNREASVASQEAVRLANDRVAQAEAEKLELNAKLGAAQRDQAEALRMKRELEDSKRELDLTIERRVAEEKTSIQTAARREAEKDLRLDLSERDLLISSLNDRIADLQQKVTQGSQQLQGEVLELDVEATLRAEFPLDETTPVPKGVHGGDIVHHVHNQSRVRCGAILLEVKRTKNFGGDWLVKLRNDTREAKADVSLLITQVLPEGVETFGLVENVWVASPKYLVPLVACLRRTLIELRAARAAADGQADKAMLVYNYLTGAGFRHRVEALVERYGELRDDLEREQKMMVKQWAKRAETLRQVMDTTVGLYGDLQGIAGKSLADAPSLELPALPEIR